MMSNQLLRQVALQGLTVLLLSGCGGAQVGLTPTTIATSDVVPADRIARLSRGVNLAFWFWYAPDDIEGRFSDADFALIRDLGFTHVRVPIDLGFIYNQTSDDLLNHQHLAYIDGAVQQAVSHSLAIILDIHSISLEDADVGLYSAGLEDDPQFVDSFVEFWERFAAHLSTTDPGMVFPEPMNEPVFEGHYQDWYEIQERLISAIRAQAPAHTLIATSTYWSNVSTFVKMKPVDDPNVVYNFHFYEPFIFTHQGATWTDSLVEDLRGVPYPSSPQAVEPILATVTSTEARNWLRSYGQERWGANRIAEMIGEAAAWGDRYGVPVTCNEFGVYQPYAEPEDRVQWYYDVRSAFERYDIGWAVWEYDAPEFGLVERHGNEVTLDADVARALGLNVSP